MKKSTKVIGLIVIAYIILLFNFTASYTPRDSNVKYTLTYNGLVWISLDHYTIWKYNSDDIGMTWINYGKKKKEND